MGNCRTPAEMAARWHDAGIPDGYTISQLLYNPASESVVIEVHGMKGAVLPERLLIRRMREHRYELVGNPEEDVSFRSPAACEKHPILVFNSMRWRKYPPARYRGADWDGLYLFDFHTRDLTLLASPKDLNIPAPYDERGWIAGVLSLSDDARYAYVKVGLGKREDERTVKYDYHVARFDLKGKDLQLISHLKNIWF